MGFAYIVKERMRQAELAAEAPKTDGRWKFIALLLVLSLYLYTLTQEFGLDGGISITALTWSFFVLCTPIADAGFLIDYPVRLIMNVRMLRTEIIVWGSAALMNLYAVVAMPGIYSTTFPLQLFYHILLNPYPYWGIILLSTIGTFLSINFGDEVVDSLSYRRDGGGLHANLKHDLAVFSVVLALVLALYHLLLAELGISIL